jgi:hypothetical protein
MPYTIKVDESVPAKSSQVLHPVLNTSFKLRDAKKHYTLSAKAHRKEEIAALDAALAAIVRGSRSKETREKNASEVKRAVKSILRAAGLKA